MTTARWRCRRRNRPRSARSTATSCWRRRCGYPPWWWITSLAVIATTVVLLALIDDAKQRRHTDD
jgi:hypothetical protein